MALDKWERMCPTDLYAECGEQQANYDTLSFVVLRTCTVAVKDVRDVEHSIEVTAETLYEAIATALAALQKDNWVADIGQGFTTVTVVVQQPPVKHEVKMKDFVSWLNRQGRSPAEVILKQKLEKILGKVVARGRDRKMVSSGWSLPLFAAARPGFADYRSMSRFHHWDAFPRRGPLSS
jgi:hypothetical protein